MIYDLGLDKNIFIDNIIDAAFQELDILFNTENCEVIGDYSYGCDFKAFLWELTPNEKNLKNYISDKISNNTFILNSLNWSVDVSIQEEDSGDRYYLVTIYIYSNDNKLLDKKIMMIK